MKNKIMKIFLTSFLIIILVGCGKEEVKKENIDVSKYNFSVSKIDNCIDQNKDYYQYQSYKVYLVCLNEVILEKDDDSMTLKYYFKNSNLDFDDSIKNITNKFKDIDFLYDGGTAVYKNDVLTIIKCNTLEGNKDIYIGDETLEKKDNYCR